MLRRLLIGLVGLVLFSTLPVAAKPLGAPENLSVTTDGTLFHGRWDPVEGASYYEVWTKLHGNWRFDEKDHSLAPFTSSFDLPGNDDRTLFRIRAVSTAGQKGDFSEQTRATLVEIESSPTPSSSSSGVGASQSGFDPQAPAPEPPTSLFAVWSDAREIRLVWQASDRATRYTIEELYEGKWVSVSKVEFPRACTAVLKDKPMPGPYQFRVRAVGRNGRASEPSRTTTAKR